MILLPESLFGIIGAGMAVLGLLIPRLARHLAETKTPGTGLFLTSGLCLTGLAGMTFFLPLAGLIPALVTYAAMYFNSFLTSFHINRQTPSAQRATVLSFKGLSYNLAYGLFGTGYALVLKFWRQTAEGEQAGQALDNLVFMESFFIFPLVFALGFTGLALFSRLRHRPD